MSSNLSEGALITYGIDEIVTSFEALDTFTNMAQHYEPNPGSMQRSSNTYFKPLQQQAVEIEGWDITGSENGVLELSIGGALGDPTNTYRTLRADDLRDETSYRRAIQADIKELMGKMEQRGLKKAAEYGAFCVTDANAFGTSFPVWDALAESESRMFDTEFNTNEGICAFLNATAYRAGGKELVEGSANFSNSLPDDAYNKGKIQRQIAGVSDVYRHNKLKNFTAQATPVTVSGAQSWAPLATEAAPSGSNVPFDHRFASLTVSTTVGVNVGDKFTIPGVFAVSAQGKEQLDYLQTFTVAQVVDGTTLQISPRPIALDDGTLSDLQKAYANVSTSFAGAASLTWLNTTARRSNVILTKDSMVLASSPIPFNHELFKDLNAETFSVGPINGMIGFESQLGKLTGFYRIALWYDWQVEKPSEVGVILDAQA